jgi:2-C-methyl-D-erythritol 4-phosphate cytidylyltransferase
MNTLAVLVAAGRGERLGAGRAKAFVPLAGRAMVWHAARAFETAASVDAIVVVVPAAELEAARGLLSGLRKIVGFVAGGERRQDSVLEGLKQAPEGFGGIVLVHDAARPLVPPALIDAVAQAARAHGAALPTLPIVDTVKRLAQGTVVETLDRTRLAAAQTPQGFRFELLVRAYESAFRDRVALSDESMAVERLGERVASVPGSPDNRKITTPDDLVWAEAALAAAVPGAR